MEGFRGIQHVDVEKVRVLLLSLRVACRKVSTMPRLPFVKEKHSSRVTVLPLFRYHYAIVLKTISLCKSTALHN